MVDDDVVFASSPCGVGAVVYVLHLRPAAADEAHDYVVAVAEIEGIIAEGDAPFRSGLSGYGGVGADVELALEVDVAADVEDDGLSSRLAEGPAERAFAGVVEVGDMDYLAASSAGDESAVSFRSREGRSLFFSEEGSAERERAC